VIRAAGEGGVHGAARHVGGVEERTCMLSLV
jgi:hypothetical protein